MKRIIAMAVCLALVATMAISGSVAYLTDQEMDENVFQVGSVDVIQHEQQRGETGLEPFVDPANRIHPMVETQDKGETSQYVSQTLDSGDTVSLRNPAYYSNYVDKIVTVENAGASEAYVRNIVAVPTGNADVEWLELDWFDMENETSSTDWQRTEIEEDVLIDGVFYDLYVFKYIANNNKLPYADEGDDITLPTLLGFGLSKHVNYDESVPTYFYQEPGGERVDVSFDPDALKILVATQAVQVAGFADFNHAFSETFGEISADNHPWKELSGGYGYVGDQLYTWDEMVEKQLVTVDSTAKRLDAINPSITSLVIHGNDIKIIGSRVANTENHQLESIVIGNGVERVGTFAFSNSINLKSVSFPSTPITLDTSAFNGSGLTSVTIPGNVTFSSNSQDQFHACKSLTTVIIEEGVTNLSPYCFQRCGNLTSVTLPSSLREIQKYAFDYCTKLPGITLPNGLEKIGERAFSDCDSMTSVTIPSSVTEIGEGAFKYCDKLKNITIENTEGTVTIGTDAFPSGATVNYNK